MGYDLQEHVALQSIIRTAHGIKEATVRSNSLEYSDFWASDALGVIDCINSPSPSPLLPLLLRAGASSEFASVVNQTYQQRAEQLRHHIQKSITTACCRAAELPTFTSLLPPDLWMKKVTSLFTEVYFQRLEEWKEEAIKRIKQASMTPVGVASANACAFNYEYVPLLERLFDENPFPTHADKTLLAKKSSMQYKQIHVWFQNRRNRTKKEGKLLRKGPTHESATKLLDKLYERMKRHKIDSDFQAPEPFEASSSRGTAKNSTSKDAFASSSPPHAFPSSYPPTCRYDPFPCKSGLGHFTKPEWRRISDCKLYPSLSTSIDDLAKMFSRLHVRDRIRSKASPGLQSHAATAAITVIPSSAPHPSLIVREYSQRPNIVQLRPLVNAPVSCPRAFRSPSPTSKPVTLLPVSTQPKKNDLLGKRKTAPLPRRYPGQMQTTRQYTPPSEDSLTSCSSSRLFSAKSDSRSCSSSNTSSFSAPSDTACIQELPHLSISPCYSLSDSPIYSHGLGDMVVISPSSAS